MLRLNQGQAEIMYLETNNQYGVGRVSLPEVTESFRLCDGVVGGQLAKNSKKLFISRCIKASQKEIIE